MSQIRFGKVKDFDFRRGLGTVTQFADGENGAAAVSDIGFHCTAIADGSRDIAIGTAVAFRVQPAANGVLEAVEIAPLPVQTL